MYKHQIILYAGKKLSADFFQHTPLRTWWNDKSFSTKLLLSTLNWHFK